MCDIWSDLWTLAFLLYFSGFFERVQSNPYYLHHHGIVCRLWTFNVCPLIGIIRLTLSWLSAMHCPSRKLMSPLGVGSGCVTLPRGDWSSVPAAVPGRPPGAYGGRSGLWPSTWQTGSFAPLRGQAQCAHNMDGRWMLTAYISGIPIQRLFQRRHGLLGPLRCPWKQGVILSTSLSGINEGLRCLWKLGLWGLAKEDFLTITQVSCSQNFKVWLRAGDRFPSCSSLSVACTRVFFPPAIWLTPPLFLQIGFGTTRQSLMLQTEPLGTTQDKWTSFEEIAEAVKSTIGAPDVSSIPRSFCCIN